MLMPILTKRDAEKLLKAQKLGHSQTLVSLDLGKSTEKVVLEGEFALLRGISAPLKDLEKLRDETCYVFDGSAGEVGGFRAVELFSPETNLYYKLKPTKDWPTIMLSSVPMHRFKHFSPKEDTKSKLAEISPVRGTVLDTCCGLGYTAIGAASAGREVNEVFVFERDASVLEIARHNPYSQELFSNPKIKLSLENVFFGIKKISAEQFDRIIHDPPTVSFSPELYTHEFYIELFRVAAKNSVLYHYCPNPGKTKGKLFWPSLKRKLLEVGFSDVEFHEKSSGIRAIKK